MLTRRYAILVTSLTQLILTNKQTKAATLGDHLQRKLNVIKDSGKYPIKDVRGLGLMVGLEFDAECAAGTSGAVTQACLEHGMLMLNTSSYANPLAPINFVFFWLTQRH